MSLHFGDVFVDEGVVESEGGSSIRDSSDEESLGLFVDETGRSDNDFFSDSPVGSHRDGQ